MNGNDSKNPELITAALENVLNYVWDNEMGHYLRASREELRQDHIFRSLVVLDQWLHGYRVVSEELLSENLPIVQEELLSSQRSPLSQESLPTLKTHNIRRSLLQAYRLQQARRVCPGCGDDGTLF